VIATFSPTSAFVRVDFPELGLPTKQTNPDREAVKRVPAQLDLGLLKTSQSVGRQICHICGR
jgi:hypothetical protein